MKFEASEISKPSEIPDGLALRPMSSDLTEQWLQLNGDLVVRNVRDAKLLSFPAHIGSELKHESIIIAPGGGMMVMAMSHEGVSLAEKFSAMGYDAYVLQYRLNPTPRDTKAFKAHCEDFYSNLLQNDFGNAETTLHVSEALEDLKLALEHIKAGRSPSETIIHFLGFSAGAYIGREFIALNHDKLHFQSVGMIYGDLSYMDIQAEQLPLLFAVMASDDPIFSRKGLGIIKTWHDHHLDPEVHFFRNGGHGFGDRINGKTSDAWLGLYTQWLNNISQATIK